MNDRCDLVDISAHSLFGDHLRGYFFSLLRRDLAKCTEFFEPYVVVELAGSKQIVLNDGASDERRAVRGGCLLLRRQNGLELLDLIGANDAIEVHLLEYVVGGQLLASLVFEQSGEEARALLARWCQNGAVERVAQRLCALAFVDDERRVERQLVVFGRRFFYCLKCI